MKRFTRSQKTGLCIAGTVALVFYLFGCGLIWGADDTHWPLYFENPGDTITIILFEDHDSTAAATVVDSVYRDTTISLDRTKHNMLLFLYKASGETYPVSDWGYYALSRASKTDSVWFHHRLYLSDAVDSVETYLITPADSSLETTYTSIYEIIDSIKLNDTVPALILDLIYIDGDTNALPHRTFFYPSGVGPAASPTNAMVTVYYDVGQGIMDSLTGNMEIRSGVKLTLELIGASSLSDGSWGILPVATTRKPNVNGRCQWHVPANTVLSPAGSKYHLSWQARDGWFTRRGSIKTFIVDTIPDPLNIIDATTVW